MWHIFIIDIFIILLSEYIGVQKASLSKQWLNHANSALLYISQHHSLSINILPLIQTMHRQYISHIVAHGVTFHENLLVRTYKLA